MLTSAPSHVKLTLPGFPEVSALMFNATPSELRSIVSPLPKVRSGCWVFASSRTSEVTPEGLGLEAGATFAAKVLAP